MISSFGKSCHESCPNYPRLSEYATTCSVLSSSLEANPESYLISSEGQVVCSGVEIEEGCQLCRAEVKPPEVLEIVDSVGRVSLSKELKLSGPKLVGDISEQGNLITRKLPTEPVTNA